MLDFIKKLVSKFQSTLEQSLEGDRAIEYAFVIRNIGNPPGKVLDVGCGSSPLTTIIATLGFSVEGVDLSPSLVRYNDVKYIQADIKQDSFKVKREKFYDKIILCSTLEHIGLGGRYTESEDSSGDVKALRNASYMLKGNGQVILTVPFGKRAVIKPFHRVYDKTQIAELCEYAGLKIIKEEYYVQDENYVWIESDEGHAAQIKSAEKHYALGLYVLELAK